MTIFFPLCLNTEMALLDASTTMNKSTIMFKALFALNPFVLLNYDFDSQSLNPFLSRGGNNDENHLSNQSSVISKKKKLFRFRPFFIISKHKTRCFPSFSSLYYGFHIIWNLANMEIIFDGASFFKNPTIVFILLNSSFLVHALGVLGVQCKITLLT